ncbi:MAG: MotA/TolQ/ExbB proton channel family protein, partial [Myxococcota bacterium]
GMAIALLTTFYGLLLAHLLYLPLARMVAAQAAERTENMNLVIEGMLKLARKRPIHEVQQLIGGADSGPRSAA